MKKICIVVSLLAFISVPMAASYAAELTIGTHASYYLPPEAGASSTVLLGADVSYNLDKYIEAQLSIEKSDYSASGNEYSRTNVPITIKAHYSPYSPLDPYVGGGVGYYDLKTNGVSNATAGLHALAGISINLAGLSGGLEYKYTIPNTNAWDVGYSSLTIDIKGASSFQL